MTAANRRFGTMAGSVQILVGSNSAELLYIGRSLKKVTAGPSDINTDCRHRAKPFSVSSQLMRQFLIIMATLFLFTSCVHYATLYTDKNADNKTAIQSYYSPCCGWCGQRVITDNLKGEQSSLLINCKLEDMYSRYCTEFRIGTQKHIDIYRKNTIRQHSVYRPVYDTVELKKIYPNLDREVYFDTLMSTRQIIPLTGLDSMLINQALAFKSDPTCNNNHLRLIRGYVFVRTDEVKMKKEKDFNTPKK